MALIWTFGQICRKHLHDPWSIDGTQTNELSWTLLTIQGCITQLQRITNSVCWFRSVTPQWSSWYSHRTYKGAQIHSRWCTHLLHSAADLIRNSWVFRLFALYLWKVRVHLLVDTLNTPRKVYWRSGYLGRSWKIVANSIVRCFIYREPRRWSILWSQNWCAHQRS